MTTVYLETPPHSDSWSTAEERKTFFNPALLTNEGGRIQLTVVAFLLEREDNVLHAVVSKHVGWPLLWKSN